MTTHIGFSLALTNKYLHFNAWLPPRGRIDGLIRSINQVIRRESPAAEYRYARTMMMEKMQEKMKKMKTMAQRFMFWLNARGSADHRVVPGGSLNGIESDHCGGH